jgi:hypothetical protein
MGRSSIDLCVMGLTVSDRSSDRPDIIELRKSQCWIDGTRSTLKPVSYWFDC